MAPDGRETAGERPTPQASSNSTPRDSTASPQSSTQSRRDGLSRRSLLGLGSVAVAGLAGCASLSEFDPLDQDRQSFPVDPLREIASGDPPREPTVFPVSVTDAMVATHRRRARELLESVPEQPTLPNEAMADELAAERQRVAEDINTEQPDEDAGIWRLEGWRNHRSEAARIAGAYRAAQGSVTRQSVVDRSQRLRSALQSFEETWSYAGADTPAGVVFHSRIEDMVWRCRRALSEWQPFPASPRDAVFAVGEIQESLEQADALVSDLRALRDRYEPAGDASSGRYHVEAASGALANRLRVSEPRLPGPGDDESTPFDRSLAGTPAQRAWEEVTDALASNHERDHRPTQPASRLLELGRRRAEETALRRLAPRIRSGQYQSVDGLETVRTRYEAARSALRTAWETEPRVLAVALAGPADDSFRQAHEELASADGRAEPVVDAVGWLIHAELYAAAVPAVVDGIAGILSRTGQ